MLTGLLVCQIALLGSSLWGREILLPLDILAGPEGYLPRASVSAPWPEPKDRTRFDLVYQAEVWRRFVVSEVRAGRMPLWDPYNYCGHPMLAIDQGQVFSPYRLLDYACPSPIAVAWSALLRALVGGIGAYLFFRRAARVTWLAAALGAWAFPLTGTMVLSAGYAGAAVVSFLPWVLLAADAVLRRPRGKSVAGLAIATACTLLAGHSAFAGHVLLVSGLYFLARLGTIAPLGIGGRRRLATTAVAGMAGVALGILLSAPQTLPLVDYLRSSLHLAMRTKTTEAKPAGPSALIQVVVPYAFGSSQRGSQYIGPVGDARIESAANGYGGLIVALVLAPLGWADPRRRRQLVFWAALFVLATTPSIGTPLVGMVFRLPPLLWLRNTRLLFAAAFAVVSAGVIGLDVWMRQPQLSRSRVGKRGMYIGVTLATAIGVSFTLRATESSSAAPGGIPWHALAAHPAALFWPDAWADVTGNDPNGWFGLMALNAVVLCVIAIGALAGLSRAAKPFEAAKRPGCGYAGTRFHFWAAPALLTALAVAEMVSMSAGVNPRTDPSLYYPRLPWMERIARFPGRVCGVDFFMPANLNLSQRIPDIRGYDAADPVPLVELLALAQTPPLLQVPLKEGVVLFLAADPAAPGPVADLLNVRYLVGRGDPPAGLTLVDRGQDYWLAENPAALPRATIPHAVKVIADRNARLQELAAPTHAPADVALLESNPARAVTAGQGQVEIVEDLPNRVRLEADMTRGGLVRLADSYDSGWRATCNGEPVDVLRVDHALRGVVAPAGRSVIEFRYEPRSFTLGLILAAVGVIATAAISVPWRRKNSWIGLMVDRGPTSVTHAFDAETVVDAGPGVEDAIRPRRDRNT